MGWHISFQYVILDKKISLDISCLITHKLKLYARCVCVCVCFNHDLSKLLWWLWNLTLIYKSNVSVRNRFQNEGFECSLFVTRELSVLGITSICMTVWSIIICQDFVYSWPWGRVWQLVYNFLTLRGVCVITTVTTECCCPNVTDLIN